MDNKENIKSKYLKRTNVLSKNFNDINEYQIEKIVEFTMCTNLLVNFDEVLSWWEVKQKQFSTSIKEIPLDKMKNWNVNSSKISHTSGKFFEILGLRIGEDTGREVSTDRWSCLSVSIWYILRAKYLNG